MLLVLVLLTLWLLLLLTLRLLLLLLPLMLLPLLARGDGLVIQTVREVTRVCCSPLLSPSTVVGNDLQGGCLSCKVLLG